MADVSNKKINKSYKSILRLKGGENADPEIEDTFTKVVDSVDKQAGNTNGLYLSNKGAALRGAVKLSVSEFGLYPDNSAKSLDELNSGAVISYDTGGVVINFLNSQITMDKEGLTLAANKLKFKQGASGGDGMDFGPGAFKFGGSTITDNSADIKGG